MSFFCITGDKSAAAKKAEEGRNDSYSFMEILYSHVFVDTDEKAHMDRKGKTIAEILSEIDEIIEDGDEHVGEHRRFANEKSVKESIDNLMRKGFVIRVESSDNETRYRWADLELIYDPDLQRMKDKEKGARAQNHITVPPPRLYNMEKTQKSPELKRQMGMLYFICDAWIKSYLDTTERIGNAFDSPVFWQYILAGINNIIATKERKTAKGDKNLYEIWRDEVGIDFENDEEISELRQKLAEALVEYRKQEGLQMGFRLGHLNYAQNDIVAEFAQKRMGEEIQQYIKAEKMYAPTKDRDPEGSDKFTPKPSESRKIATMINAEAAKNGGNTNELYDDIIGLINYMSSSYNKEKLNKEAPETKKATSGNLYAETLPAGGTMNFTDFLSMIFEMEASPEDSNIRQALQPDAEGVIHWEKIPEEAKTMAGKASDGGDGVLPTWTAPNSPTQYSSLMTAMGRKVPSNITAVVKTGFAGFINLVFNHDLPESQTPKMFFSPGKMRKIEEEYGEVPQTFRDEVQNTNFAETERYVSGTMFADDRMAYLSRIVGDSVKDDKSSEAAALRMLGRKILGMDASARTDLENSDIKVLEKEKPELLIYMSVEGYNGKLEGGKIVWRDEKDTPVDGDHEATMVMVDTNKNDIIGDARRKSKDIDARYAYAHYALVEAPIMNSLSSKEAAIDQIMRGLPTTKEMVDRFPSEETQWALRGQISAQALILLNNYIDIFSQGKYDLLSYLKLIGQKEEQMPDISKMLGGMETSGGDIPAAILTRFKQALTGIVGKETKLSVKNVEWAKSIDADKLRELLVDKDPYDWGVFQIPMGYLIDILKASKENTIPDNFKTDWLRTVELKKMKSFNKLMHHLNTDGRENTLHKGIAQWPGARDERMFQKAKEMGISISQVDGVKDAYFFHSMVANEMMKAVMLELPLLNPSLYSVRHAIVGNSLKFLNAKKSNASALASMSAWTFEMNVYGYSLDSLFHEWTHAQGPPLFGYESTTTHIDAKNPFALAGEDGANLDLFDEFLTENEGVRVEKQQYLAALTRAAYRTAYFQQFEAANKDDIYNLLKLDFPQTDSNPTPTEQQVRELIEKETASIKDPAEKRKATKKKLNHLIARAIQAHLPSSVVKSGGGNREFENWYVAGDEQYKDSAMRYMDGFLMNKYNHFTKDEEGVRRYWLSAMEMWARSSEAAGMQALLDESKVTGGKLTRPSLVKRSSFMLERNIAQRTRIYNALRQYTESIVMDKNGKIKGFFSNDFSALKSNITPEAVMDYAVDELLGVKSKKAKSMPTAAMDRTKMPHYLRRMDMAAYGDEAVFYVRGDKVGEFNTIGRFPTETAQKIMEALAFIEGAPKSPLHAYNSIKMGAITSLEPEDSIVALHILGDWLRNYLDDASIAKNSKTLPLPNMGSYKSFVEATQISDTVFSDSPRDISQTGEAYVPNKSATAFYGEQLNQPLRGLLTTVLDLETNLPTEKDLEENFGLTKDELKKAIFPHGVSSPLSINNIQYETLLRIVQGTFINADKNAYSVSQANHLAQIFLKYDEKMQELKYMPGFGEFLGTGAGKTRIHAALHRLMATSARKNADAYRKEKGKGLSHDELWKKDGEYRRIVSRGITFLVTGGADQQTLNRGTRKALWELGMLPDKILVDTKKDGKVSAKPMSPEADKEPIIEGVDGHYRFINGNYYTSMKGGMVEQEADLFNKGKLAERRHVPRPGDFLFYETYKGIVNDNLGDKRQFLPDIANSLILSPNASKLQSAVGERLSMTIEPPINFRRMLHLLGIDGALLDLVPTKDEQSRVVIKAFNHATGELEAVPNNWRRPADFYNPERYAEVEANFIYDEADNMSGIKTQGYGGGNESRIRRLTIGANPAYEEAARKVFGGKSGAKESNTGILMREMGRMFMNSRVVYGTASPFKEISSFSAMERMILPFLDEKSADGLRAIMIRLEQAKTPGIINMIQDGSNRGILFQASLPPAHNSNIMVETDENDERSYYKMLVPLHFVLRMNEKQWDGRGILMNKEAIDDINRKVSGSVSRLRDFVSESFVMSKGWGEHIVKTRKDGKSIIIPVDQIGERHEIDVIKKEEIEAYLNDRESRVKFNANGIAPKAPAELFSLKGRIKREIENSLPMLGIREVDENASFLEKTMIAEGERKITFYDLVKDTEVGKKLVEAINNERIGDKDSEKVWRGGKEITLNYGEMIKNLLSSPALMIAKQKFEDGVIFSFDKAQTDLLETILQATPLKMDGKTKKEAAKKSFQNQNFVLPSSQIRRILKLKPGEVVSVAKSKRISKQGATANAVGVKSKEMTKFLNDAMKQFPKEMEKVQSAMTEMADKLSENGLESDFMEVTGRSVDVRLDKDDRNYVVLRQRSRDRENSQNLIDFQEKKKGGVLFGSPEKIGRGIDLDWQRNTGNQQPRVLMIANPPPQPEIVLQILGRINRGSTVKDPDPVNFLFAAETQWVSAPFMRLNQIRQKNTLLRLLELSMGRSEGVLQDSSWGPDMASEQTKVETQMAWDRLADRKYGQGDEAMDKTEILEWIVQESDGEENEDGEIFSNVKPASAETLFKRFDLLPHSVALDLQNWIIQTFMDVWNRNPDKKRSTILDGRVKYIASFLGHDNIVRKGNGKIHIAEYTPAPKFSSFKSRFSPSPKVMAKMTSKELKDFQNRNHKFYQLQEQRGILPKGTVIAIDRSRRREGVIGNEHQEQNMAYYFHPEGQIEPFSRWETSEDSLGHSGLERSHLIKDGTLSRDEAEKLWTAEVEKTSSKSGTTLLTIVEGNPAAFTLPGTMPFTPILFPDPEGSGKFLNGYVLDAGFETAQSSQAKKNFFLPEEMIRAITAMFATEDESSSNLLAENFKAVGEQIKVAMEESKTFGEGKKMAVVTFSRGVAFKIIEVSTPSAVGKEPIIGYKVDSDVRIFDLGLDERHKRDRINRRSVRGQNLTEMLESRILMGEFWKGMSSPLTITALLAYYFGPPMSVMDARTASTERNEMQKEKHERDKRLGLVKDDKKKEEK